MNDSSAILSTLRSIEARLTRLEENLESIQGVKQLPKLAATATDIVDEWAARIGDADERLLELTGLLERVSEPKTLRNARAALDIAESIPMQVGTTMDILDEAMASLDAEGIDISKLAPNAKAVAIKLLRMFTAPELALVTNSGMLNPGALRLLGVTASALANAGEHENEEVGLWGVMRALKKPNTRRAVGFAMRLAEYLGAALVSEDLVSEDKKQLTAGSEEGKYE